jgi:hypothetical protein
MWSSLLKKHGNKWGVIASEIKTKTRSQCAMLAHHIKVKILEDPENSPYKDLLEFLPARGDVFSGQDEIKIIYILRQYGSINYQHLVEKFDQTKTAEQFAFKMSNMRLKATKNPYLYDEDIMQILFNRVYDRWTNEDQKLFYQALLTQGKDRGIFEAGLVPGKT